MTSLHRQGLKSALAILWKGGRANWQVLTVYMIHTNIRNRAWPSLDTISKEAGLTRDTAMTAKDWLVEHGALEPVPYDLRINEERKAPRADVMQVTGVVEQHGVLYYCLDFSRDGGDSQSSSSSTIETGNRLVALPEGTTTTTTGKAAAQAAPLADNNDDPNPVIDAWLNLTAGRLNPVHADLLMDYAEEYTVEWVVEAIKETAASKTAMQLRDIKPSYLLAILSRWRSEGRETDSRPTENEPTPPPSYMKRIS